MTYIEIFLLCMASPLLDRRPVHGKAADKVFLFCLAGMGACLLSAYINTFLAALYGAGHLWRNCGDRPGGGGSEWKLLPLLFYLLVFGPKAEQIQDCRCDHPLFPLCHL